ncbi:hypothetical protein SAMN05216244_2546 [Sediminibacillus halophilus]|uniref:Uncharacterized protein n=1 Tax=Sediminibacillus halophilus TaxID=482461 RepID=A0A1G9TDW5_9BACI|nr:hypothetical protein SAMN05216244_2546 [Sediminibacillus halophilus]
MITHKEEISVINFNLSDLGDFQQEDLLYRDETGQDYIYLGIIESS